MVAKKGSSNASQTRGEVKKQDEAKLPAAMEELEQHSGAGFEEADADSFAIPFLQILQSNSPQVKRSEGAYIKGATEGMILNTVSNELFNTEDNGITIVPIDYRRAFTSWVPRDHGGGFKGEVEVGADVLSNTERDGPRLWNEDTGLEYLDTRYHYVMLIRPDGDYEPALITMASTQIKKSRQLMTRLNNIKLQGKNGKFTPPMFANVLDVYTVPEKKDDNSWYGWKLDFQSLRQLDLSDEREREIFHSAREFRDQLHAGHVQESAPDQDAVGSSDDKAAASY